MYKFRKILSVIMIWAMVLTPFSDIYTVMAAQQEEPGAAEDGAADGDEAGLPGEGQIEADEESVQADLSAGTEDETDDGYGDEVVCDDTDDGMTAGEVTDHGNTAGDDENVDEAQEADDAGGINDTAGLSGKDDTGEMPALGDPDPGLIPVYSNQDYDTFSLDGATVIGYAKLNAPEAGRATYYCATGTSKDPTDTTTIRVPRRLAYVKIYADEEDTVGVDALLDYTEGYNLDPQGYAVEEQGGTERVQVIYDTEMLYYIGDVQVYRITDVEADPEHNIEEVYHFEYEDHTLVSDDDIRKIDQVENPLYKDLYIGTAYDVVALDKDVFQFVDVDQAATLKTRVTTIQLPAVIMSDITYKFFSGLKNMRQVEVYDSGSYDRYYVDTTAIPEFKDGYSFVRYVASGADSKNKTGEEAVFTSGALVDTWPGENGVVSKIVYCPPKYPGATYNYFYGTQNNSRTIIGEHAFQNCINLKTIRPVTPGVQVICRIEDYAFDGCTSLEDAYVFSSLLTGIGNYAFSNCENLKSVSLNPTVKTTLGVSIFANTAISQLDIPVGYDEMTGETFKDMNVLERIDVVPGSIAEEDDINQCFISIDGVLYRYEVDGYHTELEDPDIDEGIQLVRYPSLCETMAQCPDASSTLKADESFLVPYQVTYFDEYCFYKCTKVQNMYFPSTILSVGLNRFYDCKGLTNVYFYSGLLDFGVKKSDYSTTDFFGGPKTYMYVYAGEGTPIYDYAVANSKGRYRMQVRPLYYPSEYSYIYNNDNTATLLSYRPDQTRASLLEHIVIPNYVETAGGRYTVTCVTSSAIVDPGIKSVRFLHDMKDVAFDAFYTVKNREDIEDQRNVNCTKLANIYVEYGNFNIGTKEGVLYSMVWDKEKKEYVPSELLYYPVGNEAETFTTIDGISILPEFAFWGAKHLKTINIYDTVQDIGLNSKTDESDEPMCFAGCGSLIFVNIIHSEGQKPTNIRYYSDNGVLYRWDPNADTSGAPVILVYYPKGKREMSEDGTSPVSYVVADGCREVRYVRDCPYLTGIVFPRSVTTIADYAFSGSMALSSIEFKKEGESPGEGIKTIGEEAFAYTDISAVSIPAGIESIGNRAFYDCNEIETIYIEGNSLRSIGDEAFGCKKASVGTSALVSLEIVCTLENETGGNLVIGDGAFRSNTMMTKLSIKNMGKTVIGNSAFRDSTSLKELDFTNTDITALGIHSFQDCKSLERLELADLKSVTEIPGYCFYGCEKLEDVILPVSAVLIDEYAFKNCYYLSNLNFRDLTALMEIGCQAFASTGFIAVNLPPNLVTLGDSVFVWNAPHGTGLLSTIYVPQSVIFSDEFGNYSSKSGSGPFFDYGPDTYVYGVAGSDVDLYLQWMESKGYVHPTFVGADEMPQAEVDLDQSSLEIYNVGEVLPTLTAVVTSQDDLRDYSVKWYVMDSSVCQVTKEDFDGINRSRCNVEGKKIGSTRIYAINKQTGASDYCVVTVKNADVEVHPSDENTQNVDGMVLPKSIILNCRGDHTKASLNATSNPPRKIYYRSNDRKVVRVNRRGIATGKKQGQTTITAYAGQDDTYVEADVEVTVFKPTISLDKKKIILNSEGSEDDMKAVINVSHYGAYNDVEWVSSKPRLFTVEGDNESATITAVKGCPGGKGFVFAYCNGIKAKCRVTVTKAGTRLDTTSLLLYAGQTSTETYQLKATVSGKQKDVLWNSSDTEVATVDQKGLVTSVAPGKAQITATCNGITATCTVNVVESYVKIYGPNSGDAADELKSIVINANGDNRAQLRARVVGREDDVTWESESPNTFTVDKEGLLVGKSGGTANVLAMANGDTAACEVTVIDNYTRLDYSKMVLYMSGSQADKMITLTAQINGADTTRKVTWEIEDPEVLAMSAVAPNATMTDSEYEGTSVCTFTALKEGATRVKVTANGVEAYCNITVKK